MNHDPNGSREGDEAHAAQPERPLPGDSRAYDFFQAVRLLEGLVARMDPAHVPVGRRGPCRAEGIRFRASSALGFPTSDLEAVRWVARPDGGALPRAELTTHFLGLTGATSPLPASYVEEVLLEQESAPQLKDFLDLFHHRLLSLLYRAWLRHRHAFAFGAERRDPLSHALLELIDVRPEQSAEALGLEPVRLLKYLGLLLMPTRPAEGLERLLSEELEAPVRVEPLQPRQVEIRDDERFRFRCGGAPWRMGQNVVMGRRMWDRAGLCTLVVGPVSAERLSGLEPGGADFRRLVLLARLYLEEPMDLCVKVLVPACEMPRFRMGGAGRSRMRKTAVMGTPRQDPVVLTFRVGAIDPVEAHTGR